MHHISLMSAAGQQLAERMGVADAAIAAVLGYVVVFVGLILLMAVVILLGKVMAAARAKKAPEAGGAPAGGASAPASEKDAAPGSAGQVKLYGVPDKDAAMIMAIVADKMGKPLNELRFKSIKEVKEL